MNILLHDPYGLKFTQDMKDWWENHGHQVEYQRYYNPKLANEWADVIWFDTADNNIKSATNPGAAILDDSANYQPWDLHDMDLNSKKVIVRPIDIEVWQGHHSEVDWSLVDDVIFIAPHVRRLAENDIKGPRIHTIPCGVDLSKWTFKERGPDFDIAVVSERWVSKGTDLVLQVALKLKQIDKRYKIHWLGQLGGQGAWEHEYFTDFIQHHKLNIEITNILNDGRSVDEFLEGKNYLLHGSKKEGFSYATAEAMAKGIKPVIHRFFGADDIWPDMTWDSIDQAVEMITDNRYDSQAYRQYLIDKGYTVEAMMQKIQKVVDG